MLCFIEHIKVLWIVKAVNRCKILKIEALERIHYFHFSYYVSSMTGMIIFLYATKDNWKNQIINKIVSEEM